MMNQETGMPDLPKLNPKQQIFVNEYFANDFNATHAYMIAYPNSKNPRIQASMLLTNVNVKAHVDAEMQRIKEECRVKHERRVKELETILSLDINDFLDVKDEQDGSQTVRFKPTHLLKKGLGKHVQQISISPGGKITLKLENKEVAREMLNKHYGFYEKDNSQKVVPAAQIYLPDNGRDETK